MLDSCEFTEQTHGHALITQILVIVHGSECQCIAVSHSAVRQIELEVSCNNNNNNKIRRNGEFEFRIDE